MASFAEGAAARGRIFDRAKSLYGENAIGPDCHPSRLKTVGVPKPPCREVSTYAKRGRLPMSNRVDYKGWILGDEAEEYLDKFDQVQRLTGRIRFVSGQIGQVAELLRSCPQRAFASIHDDWPTREQLREMVKAWEDAKAQLPNYWNRLSEDIRRAMQSKHPEAATEIRIRVPDDY